MSTITNLSPFREYAQALEGIAQTGADLLILPGVSTHETAVKSIAFESAATINLLLDIIDTQQAALERRKDTV